LVSYAFKRNRKGNNYEQAEWTTITFARPLPLNEMVLLLQEAKEENAIEEPKYHQLIIRLICQLSQQAPRFSQTKKFCHGPVSAEYTRRVKT
jgi:hypothetical protein